jgi:hypothetical protein
MRVRCLESVKFVAWGFIFHKWIRYPILCSHIVSAPWGAEWLRRDETFPLFTLSGQAGDVLFILGLRLILQGGVGSKSPGHYPKCCRVSLVLRRKSFFLQEKTPAVVTNQPYRFQLS